MSHTMIIKKTMSANVRLDSLKLKMKMGSAVMMSTNAVAVVVSMVVPEQSDHCNKCTIVMLLLRHVRIQLDPLNASVTKVSKRTRLDNV